MSPIICDEEKEEDMDSNLRAEFHERQCKHLSESIAVNPTPSKKACSKPASAPTLMSVPPTTATVLTPELDKKLPSADEHTYHETRRSFINSDNFNKESFEYMTFFSPHSKSTYVPNWEEVSELLKRIPFFTERESSVQNMGVLFPATQQIPIEIDNDPSRSFTTWLLYGTPNTAISHIIPM